MNLYSFVTGGARNGGIAAPPTWCTLTKLTVKSQKNIHSRLEKPYRDCFIKEHVIG